MAWLELCGPYVERGEVNGGAVMQEELRGREIEFTKSVDSIPIICNGGKECVYVTRCSLIRLGEFDVIVAQTEDGRIFMQNEIIFEESRRVEGEWVSAFIVLYENDSFCVRYFGYDSKWIEVKMN
jgi:hypothetical protein